jgi:hypothetical protein
MKNIFHFIKSLSLTQYFFTLVILGYLPILVFGYFIQDDYTILGLTELNYFEAVKSICYVNNNRPLSCFYHALLSRLPPIFQIYFLFSLSVYFIFIYMVFRIYDFILDDIYIKKIFLTFLIFPFFSYTIIYSPGMQSMGILSLIFWSISLFFLKKYIYKSFLFDLFLSYFFLVIMFLTYESAAPLIGLSLFFPLFFKNKKKIFFTNIILTFLTLILIYVLQKEIFPNLFNQDLSRIKLGLQDYEKIIYLIIVNSVLTVNIFAHSLELFARSLYNIFSSYNLILLLQLLLMVFFFYLSIDNKKRLNSHRDYYFLSIFLFSITSVFILNILMHSLANTGLEFTQYNNRALVSISCIFSLSAVFFYKFGAFRSKFIFNFFCIILFTILSANFFFFQNNLIRERFLAKELLRDAKQLINKNYVLDSKYKNNVNFFIYDRPNVEEIFSYNSLDYFRVIEETENNVNFFLNENKFCNLEYYNPYIKIALLNEENKLNLFYYSNNKLTIFLENIKFKDFRNNLENIIKCNYKEISEKSSNIIQKSVYLDKRFESFFLQVIKKIYFNLWVKNY